MNEVVFEFVADRNDPEGSEDKLKERDGDMTMLLEAVADTLVALMSCDVVDEVDFEYVADTNDLEGSEDTLFQDKVTVGV